MNKKPTAAELLDKEFLPVRAKLLEVAASLDRINRAGGLPTGDARSHQLAEAIRLLAAEGDDRAEQMQLLFSLPYDDGWRKRFGI